MKRNLQRTMLLALVFAMAITGLRSQTVTYDLKTNSDTVLNVNSIFGYACTHLELNAKVTHNSDSSVVRVLMTDNHGIERLVFESYPFICSGMTDTLVKVCEETKYIAYGLKAMTLSIYIKDAEIDLDNIKITNKIHKNCEQQAKDHKIDVETAKVAQMNQNLINREMLWRAKFNSDCLQNFSVKANYWGAYDFNSEGYEYFSGGYYSEYSRDSYYRNTTENSFSHNETFYDNTSSFDWRKKHNAHLASSPYFDGNPDFDTH